MSVTKAKATPRTGGRATVHYRDAKGTSRDAVVVGGTLPNLNLEIRSGRGGTRLLTGIAKATTKKQTNRWY